MLYFNKRRVGFDANGKLIADSSYVYDTEYSMCTDSSYVYDTEYSMCTDFDSK